MKKLRINDIVKVIAGKQKGQQGKVLKIYNDGYVVVEGIALQSKFIKKGMFGKGQPGQIIKKEGKIHISNVMVVCPKCEKPTRVQIIEKDGKKFRQCKKCGALIDEIYAKQRAKAAKKADSKAGKDKDSANQELDNDKNKI